MSSASQQYQYFRVVAMPPPKGVTKVYDIISRSQRTSLGTIRWYGSWRQYCFYPQGGTVWSDGCLRDVKHALDAIKAEHAAGLAARKAAGV
jgi:hypothetical protein